QLCAVLAGDELRDLRRDQTLNLLTMTSDSLKELDVRDRDRRLVSERLEEFDLLRGEGLDVHATDRDATDPDAVSNERHREGGAVSPSSLQLDADRVLSRIEVGGVSQVNRVAIADAATDKRSAAHRG